MKNAVIGFILFVILVFTGVTIYTIEGKTTRKNELDSNLGAAMEQSMTIFTIDPTYTVEKENNDHLIADFIENFLVKTTTDSTFTIDVLEVDAEKGLLDVKVTEEFNQFVSKGHVSCRKTVILEDYENSDNEVCEVSFYLPVEVKDKPGQFENQIVKSLQINKGAKLANEMLPTVTEREGYVFKGWKLEGYDKIYTDISELTVMKNPQNFVGVFEKSN